LLLLSCRGGNVSITGITVQASSASVGGGSADDANANTTLSLKTRTAAFNGTLGFWTLGVNIDVAAEFKLQRWGAAPTTPAGVLCKQARCLHMPDSLTDWMTTCCGAAGRWLGCGTVESLRGQRRWSCQANLS
jgi:hypothetical protein